MNYFMEYKLKENIDYQYEGFSPYRAINIIKIGHISPSPPKKLRFIFLKRFVRKS